MQVKVIKQFDGVENGAIYPRTYKVGEIVTGRLAEVALAEKWGEEVKADQKQSSDGGPIQIPDGWESFKAAEVVKLAHALGAPPEVNTKAEATAFVSEEVARRANPAI